MSSLLGEDTRQACSSARDATATAPTQGVREIPTTLATTPLVVVLLDPDEEEVAGATEEIGACC